MADEERIVDREPTASRPCMEGYGVPQSSKGMLPWEWARDRLARSHKYLLTTTRPDGAPHAMPVWGVWLNGAWYCSAGEKSRKARNLAKNPSCVVSNENAAEAVILEGGGRRLTDSEIPLQLAADYRAKYGWELQGAVFEVRPRVVFAMPEEQFPAGVTRWHFR